MKVAAFDTETSGFLLPDNVPIKKQPRIIEVCVCFFDDEDFIKNENQYYSSLVNPGLAINKEIEKVTGITPQMLYEAPRWERVRVHLLKRILNAEIVVAHNLYFDKKIVDIEERRLENEPVKWPQLFCTVDNSEHLLGKRLKMSELYVHLTEKEFPKKIHRAREDVELLVEVYMKMKELGLVEEF